MSSSFDTLNIAPLRRGTELPMAQVEAANHPEAADLARQRIAGIEEATGLVDAKAVPALPTHKLETDRYRLADQVAAAKPAPVTRIASRSNGGIPTAAKPFVTAVGVFFLLLVLLKSPVIFSQLQYLFDKPQAAQVTQTSASAVIPAEATISIPKINVYAPVMYEPSIAEASVQKALETGVVHYGNTPNPGQPGNAVIFGHSSNDWWEPGNYKFIFGLLDKMAPGDRFSVDYESKRYIYEVTSTKVVAPTDVSVLNPTSEPTMTLITCTPPGTSLKRLIVVAKQVDPAPSAVATTDAATSVKEQALPGAPSSFLDQVGQAVSGIVNGIGSLIGLGGETGASPAASPQTTTALPAVK